jgi:hypothetical protein
MHNMQQVVVGQGVVVVVVDVGQGVVVVVVDVGQGVVVSGASVVVVG